MPIAHGEARQSVRWIEGLGEAASRISGRLMPDPFVIAVLLTLVSLLLAFILGDFSSETTLSRRLGKLLVDGWAGGLFGAGGLQFAFQMVLVLVTGHALALSSPVQRLLDWVARIPRTSAQASAVVALTACVSGYLHWGLGAVAGAMLAREIGRAWKISGRSLHYPLLGAAAYSGMLVWHGGLSGSAPLKVAEPGHFLVQTVGVIPVDETLFGGLNLAVTLSLVLVTIILYVLLTPERSDSSLQYRGKIGSGNESSQEKSEPDGHGQYRAIRWLEQSFVIPLALVILAYGYLGHEILARGFGALNLNTLNLFFFASGLLLHGSPRSYISAAADGAKGSVGIILQFPLYFGILGILRESGLVLRLSDLFVAISSQHTLPAFVFFSAGLVNLFVPSGGGQWALQGPVVMNAAKSLGVEPARAVMALAYGDAWTNLLQPFWALPLLGIMGLRARDIIGYTTLLLLVSAPIVLFWLLIW